MGIMELLTDCFEDLLDCQDLIRILIGILELC